MYPRVIIVSVLVLYFSNRTQAFLSISVHGRTPPMTRSQCARSRSPYRGIGESGRRDTSKVSRVAMAIVSAGEVESFIDLSGGVGGCLKKVIHPGNGSGLTPGNGCKVRIGYSITLSGQTGTLIASTEPGANFEFILGASPSEAMSGWDLAIPTMEKGEKALVICKPRYAYGSKGAPPKIPENATLECEIELREWEETKVANKERERKQGYANTKESDHERMERWKREMEDGTSPMKAEIGLKEKVYEETSSPEAEAKKKFVDMNDPEIRKQAKRQTVCGQGPGYTYLEKGGFLDLFIKVPSGTSASEIQCSIKPKYISVKLASQPEKPLLEGPLHGSVDIDGSYWAMSDSSIEEFDGVSSDIGFSLRKGGRFVEVYLYKKPPDDTIWPTVLKEEEGD